MYKTPIIGQKKYLHAKRKRSLFIDAFVAGGLSIIGVFFLGLSLFWGNNKLFIYFGLFTILFSFWYINFGTHAFKVSFPDISWSLAIRLTYISFYGFVLFLSLFIYEAFKHFFGRRYLTIVLIAYSVLFLITVVGTPWFFSSLTLYAYLIVFGQLLFTAFVFIGKVRKKVKKYFFRHFLIPSLVIVCLLILGWFFNYLPWVSEVLGLLFLLVFLVLAISMSRKVGGDYQKVMTLQQEAIVQKEKIQEQATKLRLLDEMKTRFFANVSHDLRSPLTLIKGGLYKLKQIKKENPEEYEPHIEAIDENVNQLIHFTDEIRDLNLLDNKEVLLSYSTIEINAFLKVSTDLFQSYGETRRINLSFEPFEHPIEIRADQNKFRRVLNNLMSNAFKFTEDGGTIELSVGKNKQGVVIELLDTGTGIPKEEQAYVFDRFYQGSKNDYRQDEGMGIGLALVKELVLIHGGTIDLKSEINKGSTFYLFLPFNLDKALDTLETHNTSTHEVIRSFDSKRLPIDYGTREKESNQTILLVDDHIEVRDYIASVISDEYYVIEANNGI